MKWVWICIANSTPSLSPLQQESPLNWTVCCVFQFFEHQHMHNNDTEMVPFQFEYQLSCIITCQNLQFLASMFVCRFVTCQNLQFWQVCSFVGLLLAKIYNFWQVCSFVGVSVCLSVSLSVLSSITHERFDISSPNLVHIWNGWAVPVCDIDK